MGSDILTRESLKILEAYNIWLVFNSKTFDVLNRRCIFHAPYPHTKKSTNHNM
jgi:hypothetical protein